MSDSASLQDTNCNESSAGSGHSNVTTGLTSTSVPLAIVPAFKHAQIENKIRLSDIPELPSHRFQFSMWHDLRSVSIKGTELRAPRVREGPPIKDDAFYQLKDNDEVSIHHSLQGTAKVEHRKNCENWENATSVSLCYQELQHKYQRDSFNDTLKRCHNATSLILVDNSITSLFFMSFPKCQFLNLNKNYISSFRQLPSVPKIKFLSLEDNNIGNFAGLEKLSSSLQTLYLRGNPITFIVNYRQTVFKKLPHLKILDGIPKLPADNEFDDTEDIPSNYGQTSSCVLM